MKKIYFSLLLGGLTFSSAIAQKAELPLSASELNHDSKSAPSTSNDTKSGTVIWTNNFDNPSDWVIDNDGQTGAEFGWTIDNVVDGWWSAASGINSTSGGNFAEVSNGDPTASPATQVIGVTYTMTLAVALDIPNLPLNTTNTSQVSLQWEEYGARFYDLQEVQVSTDGINFTTVRDNLDYPQYTSSGGAPYANPETVSANISSFIQGNPNNVYIRFSWTSLYSTSTNANAWITYGWYVDDVKLVTLPNDDLQLWSVWIAGENNDFIEYGRTPQDMQDNNWLIGGQVFNNGVNDQTNVELNADFTAFTALATSSLIASGDTAYVETLDPQSLIPATYVGNYELTSTGEQPGGLDFGDNTGSRQFAITPPTTAPLSIYSQDGIGIYTNPASSSLGTNSFTGGEDGFICAAKYHIKQTADLSGIRVMLASGSVAGGQIFAHMVDSTMFWDGDFATPFGTTQLYTLTSQNITAGYVDLFFNGPLTLAAGKYYAAVEMYSNGGANTIRIKDDITVPQPWDASAIFIPNDQSWSNGNAFGIRLLMGGSWLGLNDNTLSGVSAYPNPTDGVITVSNDKGVNVVITVSDMAGKTLIVQEASTTVKIDLTSFETGTYVVQVKGEEGSYVENIVVK